MSQHRKGKETNTPTAAWVFSQFDLHVLRPIVQIPCLCPVLWFFFLFFVTSLEKTFSWWNLSQSLLPSVTPAPPHPPPPPSHRFSVQLTVEVTSQEHTHLHSDPSEKWLKHFIFNIFTRHSNLLLCYTEPLLCRIPRMHCSRFTSSFHVSVSLKCHWAEERPEAWGLFQHIWVESDSGLRLSSGTDLCLHCLLLTNGN